MIARPQRAYASGKGEGEEEERFAGGLSGPAAQVDASRSSVMATTVTNGEQEWWQQRGVYQHPGDGGERNSSGDEFGSNDTQPPSPVASSGIFGGESPEPLYSPVEMDMFNARLPDGARWEVWRESVEEGNSGVDDEADDRGDDGIALLIPEFPEPSRSRSSTMRSVNTGGDRERRVRFDDRALGSEAGSGSSGGSGGGSKAFL